jgi:Ca2+-binding RTX toxin-like protein
MRLRSKLIGILVIGAVGASMTSSAGTAPLNVIYGTGGHDKIAATPAADVIYAKSGNDIITGLGTGDVVYASSGNDKMYVEPFTTATNMLLDGNVGHDRIEASTAVVGDSTINGGSGNDVILVSGCGNDVTGESGNDKYTNQNSPTCLANPNTASLGNGHDEVFLLYASYVHLGNGNDKLDTIVPGTVIAGSGNDRVEIELGGNADVQLGAGHDFLDIETAGNVTAFGSNGRDRVVIGHAGNNTINTGDGDDRIELDLAVDNVLDGAQGTDKVVIDPDSSGNTCLRIERVVDFGGHPAVCH